MKTAGFSLLLANDYRGNGGDFSLQLAFLKAFAEGELLILLRQNK